MCPKRFSNSWSCLSYASGSVEAAGFACSFLSVRGPADERGVSANLSPAVEEPLSPQAVKLLKALPDTGDQVVDKPLGIVGNIADDLLDLVDKPPEGCR